MSYVPLLVIAAVAIVALLFFFKNRISKPHVMPDITRPDQWDLDEPIGVQTKPSPTAFEATAAGPAPQSPYAPYLTMTVHEILTNPVHPASPAVLPGFGGQGLPSWWDWEEWSELAKKPNPTTHDNTGREIRQEAVDPAWLASPDFGKVRGISKHIEGPDGTSKTFTFEAEANERVMLTAAETAGPKSQYVYVTDPDGATEKHLGVQPRMFYRAPRKGVYSFTLRLEGAGHYSVQVNPA